MTHHFQFNTIISSGSWQIVLLKSESQCYEAWYHCPIMSGTVHRTLHLGELNPSLTLMKLNRLFCFSILFHFFLKVRGSLPLSNERGETEGWSSGEERGFKFKCPDKPSRFSGHLLSCAGATENFPLTSSSQTALEIHEKPLSESHTFSQHYYAAVATRIGAEYLSKRFLMKPKIVSLGGSHLPDTSLDWYSLMQSYAAKVLPGKMHPRFQAEMGPTQRVDVMPLH